MPLRVSRRAGSRLLWVTGTIRGQRIRESTGTDQLGEAEEYRAAREAALYRAAIYGARPPIAFAAAAESYITAAGPHSAATLARLRRVVEQIGPRAMLADITQHRIDQLAAALAQLILTLPPDQRAALERFATERGVQLLAEVVVSGEPLSAVIEEADAAVLDAVVAQEEFQL